MNIIQAALAFALIMIVMSTIVSGFAETLNRLLALRKWTLRETVRKFLTNVVWPTYKPKEEDQNERDYFVQHRIELNTLRDRLTKNVISALTRDNVGVLYFWNSQAWLDELSTPAFLERFAKTDVGRVFYNFAEEKRRNKIVDLSLSYDRYLAASQELYRKSTQKLAFGLAIAFAVAANIHLSRLVEYLGSNPEAVAQIVDNQEAIERLADQSETVSQEAVDEQLGEFIELGTELGLPVGWSYWPYGLEGTESSGLWLLNCLAAGVLIGLGAPFWYRITRGISQARALGVVLADNESVGTSPVVHDHEAVTRAEANYELFLASAAASWGAPERSEG